MDAEYRNLAVVPTVVRNSCMQAAHDDVTGGHLGIKRTYDALRERFWWAGMYRDVEEYVASCIPCQRSKSPAIPSEGPLQAINSSRPWQILGMDIVGPLPASNGYRFVLSFVDHFSGFPFAFPLRRHTAEEVARVLVDEIIPLIGVPEKILTDQGAEFNGHLLTALLKFLQARKLTTTAYHPECNGTTERFHRVFKEMLSKFCDKHQRDWPIWIPFLLLAYRSSKHSTHRYTPVEVAFGFRPVIPLDRLQLAELGQLHAVDQEHYVSQLLERWEDTLAFVNLERTIARRKMEERADSVLRPMEYAIGSLVWLWTPHIEKGASRKLTLPWQGPYRIISRSGPSNYILQVPGKHRVLSQTVPYWAVETVCFP